MASESDLLDRFAVADLLARYARACDEKDFAGIRGCFTSDASLSYGITPAFNGSADDFAALAERILAESDSTQHLLGNVVVNVDGDRATSQAYVQTTHVEKSGAPRTSGGVYSDELVRTPEGWRIARRTYHRQFRHA
jgi:ketosteroid isomerase-like protein